MIIKKSFSDKNDCGVICQVQKTYPAGLGVESLRGTNKQL